MSGDETLIKKCNFSVPPPNFISETYETGLDENKQSEVISLGQPELGQEQVQIEAENAALICCCPSCPACFFNQGKLWYVLKDL